VLSAVRGRLLCPVWTTHTLAIGVQPRSSAASGSTRAQLPIVLVRAFVTAAVINHPVPATHDRQCWMRVPVAAACVRLRNRAHPRSPRILVRRSQAERYSRGIVRRCGGWLGSEERMILHRKAEHTSNKEREMTASNVSTAVASL